ncbi:hypothetical protein R0J90_05535 [Micrococcus sp. SIMBA_144]
MKSGRAPGSAPAATTTAARRPPCGGRRAAVVVVPARGRCPVDQAFAAI